MTTPATRSITIEIPVPLAKQLEETAASLKRPLEQLVCEAVESWLQREIGHDRLTREGMDDVDAGRTVSHDDVLAWVEQLEDGLSTPLPSVK